MLLPKTMCTTVGSTNSIVSTRRFLTAFPRRVSHTKRVLDFTEFVVSMGHWNSAKWPSFQGRRIDADLRCRMISQDAEMYPDPDDFRPERFLCPEGTTAPMDPRLFAFGYGRRWVRFGFSGQTDARIQPSTSMRPGNALAAISQRWRYSTQ